MPTVLRWRGYRFYFFSNEGQEPPPIHVDKGEATAKLWLAPVEIALSIGYSPREMAEIRSKVEAERPTLEQAWHAYFGH